jgi:DNA (cytosine-5)-methyltransferase 1
MLFAEFFAGIGLVRLGLERSGWMCAFANDIDPKKLEMYREQFPDAGSHFILGDIRLIDGRELPQVDLATASFPCTDLSLAGARAGLAGEHSSALWPFLEVLHKVEQIRPRLVLLENVPGFLTSHKGADFKSALSALNRLGYDVDAFIIDAARFVPQSRPRLFVVGIYEPAISLVKERPRRQPSFFESDLRPAALARFILDNDDLRWRIRDLPSLPNVRKSLPDILEELPDNAPEWWSEERATYLLNQMSPRHRALADAMVKGSEITVGTVFRRIRKGKSMAELRVDGIAGCLRTPKGGSARQILFVAGQGSYRARLLTPRECARLMGADDFKISVPSNQALFGFGDAVCVPVIDWVARNYLNVVLAEPKIVQQRLVLQ